LAALVTCDAMIGAAGVALPRRAAMNGVHDMGGDQAWARSIEKTSPSSAAWEGRVYAVNRVLGLAQWDLDASRHGVETPLRLTTFA
jgi:hypothetical protein